MQPIAHPRAPHTVGALARRAALLLLAGQALLACSALHPEGSDQPGPYAMPVASDDDDKAALGKQLANPIAALISVPFQYNYNNNFGPTEHGDQSLLKIQPVVPIELNEDWNVISRTILPVISQSDIFPGAGDQSGIGDITQSFFFSPKAPTGSGWIWGVGPAFLLPTGGSSDLLSAHQWGAGPTGVVLKQEGPWTYGALANHIWSFAGSDNYADVNATFLQPFLSYTTATAYTYSLNSESTYNWETDDWSVPFNGLVTKVTKFGDQLVSVGGGLTYWAHDTGTGPSGLGIRLQLTLLYPKKPKPAPAP